MNEVEFTILIPCLNEEKTVGYCIREAKSAIRHYGISAEILIADNGSSDASKEIAKKNGARVIEGLWQCRDRRDQGCQRTLYHHG